MSSLRYIFIRSPPPSRFLDTMTQLETSREWANPKGEFVRQTSQFRNWIARNSDEFPPEANRYHLYVSWACPWAHRTIIMRALKGLDKIIGLSVVDPVMGEEGWKFSDGPDCIPDTINGCKSLKELYLTADPSYSARFTVPVLWDTKKRTIVNNESSEIIRMLNSEFNQFSSDPERSYYPEPLRKEIDTFNDWIYPNVNNGVYKAGFATDQEVYERETTNLFNTLDSLDGHLKENRFLCGDTFTEADIRLFTTLLRFDPVYNTHFKCNLKSISGHYPNLLRFLRDVYQFQYPRIAQTVHMDHIKKHYYLSHTKINPNRIIGLSNGPDLTVKAIWPSVTKG
jgi:glutathionyl-hydroquinone reductase